MSGGVIRMMCPNLKCRRVLAVPQSARGKNVRCGSCGAFVQVPAASEQQRSEPSAEPGSQSEAAGSHG